jgi:excisionase family DNA binding protein
MNDFVTPEQAAEKLLVKPSTLKSWLRSGKLRGVKAGKFWRIPFPELERFIKATQGAA